MQIEIQARTFTLTEGLRTYAQKRLRHAFSSAANRIHRIIVRLTDDNGPRGGVDKRCQIRAVVAGARPIVIDQRDADVYAAIDRAAERAGRTTTRRLARATRRRRPGRSDFLVEPMPG